MRLSYLVIVTSVSWFFAAFPSGRLVPRLMRYPLVGWAIITLVVGLTIVTLCLWNRDRALLRRLRILPGLALTAAIWDDGTLVLDRYEAQLSVDRAVRDGHLYSDKAPGQPLLAVPFYAMYRGVGGEPVEAVEQLAEVFALQQLRGVWRVRPRGENREVVDVRLQTFRIDALGFEHRGRDAKVVGQAEHLVDARFA